jgi:hypothetical protein
VDVATRTFPDAVAGARVLVVHHVHPEVDDPFVVVADGGSCGADEAEWPSAGVAGDARLEDAAPCFPVALKHALKANDGSLLRLSCVRFTTQQTKRIPTMLRNKPPGRN